MQENESKLHTLGNNLHKVPKKNNYILDRKESSYNLFKQNKYLVTVLMSLQFVSLNIAKPPYKQGTPARSVWSHL